MRAECIEEMILLRDADAGNMIDDHHLKLLWWAVCFTVKTVSEKDLVKASGVSKRNLDYKIITRQNCARLYGVRMRAGGCVHSDWTRSWYSENVEQASAQACRRPRTQSSAALMSKYKKCKNPCFQFLASTNFLSSNWVILGIHWQLLHFCECIVDNWT